jgi:hypothetical protein
VCLNPPEKVDDLGKIRAASVALVRSTEDHGLFKCTLFSGTRSSIPRLAGHGSSSLFPMSSFLSDKEFVPRFVNECLQQGAVDSLSLNSVTSNPKDYKSNDREEQNYPK